MLEDHSGDVLRKAILGAGIQPSQLAQLLGTSIATLNAYLNGNAHACDPSPRVPTLGLDESAFRALGSPYPPPPALLEVSRLTLPFGTSEVNAWLVDTGGSRILVDTGCGGNELAGELVHPGKLPDLVLITHSHRDHTGGIQTLLAHGVKRIFAWDLAETIPMRPGDEVQAGTCRVSAFDLSGHCIPALGYRFHGLCRPVIAVGDAVFAGSIGGCKTPETHRLALERIRTACAELPDDTLLLPGHGPATTLGVERKRNPFLAGMV